jgi:hypothetical protein
MDMTDAIVEASLENAKRGREIYANSQAMEQLPRDGGIRYTEGRDAPYT